MLTKVVFETATVADAAKKAARVAPSKAGSAFDKAAGIVLDIFPDEDVKCVIRATDTDVFSTEVLATVAASGPEVRWRLPSVVLANVLGQLPIGHGQQVAFEQIGSEINITAGRMRAKLRLMDASYYPDWDVSDTLGMLPVSGLGGRLAMVEWASTSDREPPMCGVHLDGEYAIATDRYRLVRVPCRVALPHPVTIPSNILGNVLKPLADVNCAVQGGTLHIAVDDYTQIQTVIYDLPYPDVKRVMKDEYPEKIEVGKGLLMSKLSVASSFAGAERQPVLQIFIGKQELAVYMTNQEVGLLGDVIELGEQAHHPRATIRFNPKNLIQAIEKAPSDKIQIGYDPDNVIAPLYINGGSGYEAWVVPLRAT